MQCLLGSCLLYATSRDPQLLSAPQYGSDQPKQTAKKFLSRGLAVGRAGLHKQGHPLRGGETATSLN